MSRGLNQLFHEKQTVDENIFTCHSKQRCYCFQEETPAGKIFSGSMSHALYSILALLRASLFILIRLIIAKR
jgi:hypothetical protein